MDTRFSLLLDRLRAIGPLAVAFSGGVDSTLLAFAASQALGPEALALTAATEFTSGRDLELARDKARTLRLTHRVLELSVLADPQVAANGPRRCYHCKRLIMSTLLARFPGRPLAEGTNADDDPARPGLAALAELGVLSPLADCGLAKAEVRELSRDLGLPGWDEPSNSCLATRQPPDAVITRAELARVEAMEQALRGLGLRDIRARNQGVRLRLEVPAGDLEYAENMLPDIRPRAASLGFATVLLARRNA